jgi:plasmid stabilization system protein ParE
MKSPKPYEISNRAEAEIAEARDYLADNSEAAARKLMQSLRRKLTLLQRCPNMGRERPDLVPGVRGLLVGDHKILIYQNSPDALHILRFVDARQNLAEIFKPRPRRAKTPEFS